MRSILRPVGAGVAVLVSATLSAVVGIGIAPAHAAPEPTITHAKVVVPSEVPTHAEAERWYADNLGPSLAWRHATKAERAYATAAYLHEYGSFLNGCTADLHHAYQGTIANDYLIQPSLPVTLNGVNDDVLWGEFSKGVCG